MHLTFGYGVLVNICGTYKENETGALKFDKCLCLLLIIWVYHIFSSCGSTVSSMADKV
jgi:hypothetical protein